MELIKRCRDFLNKVWNRVSLSIAELIFGICVLINSSGFANILFIVAGILLLLDGMVNGFLFIKESAEQAEKKHYLFICEASILVGLLCIVKSTQLVEIFPLLTVFYGTIVLLIGLIKVEMLMIQVRTQPSGWYMTLVSLLITLINALFLFFNPFISTQGIWILTGILLILTAVVDFLCHLVLIGNIQLPEAGKLAFKKKHVPKTQNEAEPAENEDDAVHAEAEISPVGSEQDSKENVQNTEDYDYQPSTPELDLPFEKTDSTALESEDGNAEKMEED